jgi:Heparinase II/III-like protein/Alginate lyase
MRKIIRVLEILGLLSPLLLGACGRLGLRRNASDESTTRSQSVPVALEPLKLPARAPGAVPYRILLDERALAQLQESARLRSPAFVYAQTRADEALAKPLESGYQGFEWADAVASSALLWHATADARYATTALRYLKALLDDRLTLGDGKGGADVITHDSGYGMRTFGAYAALGYDWLRDAPGMTDALRAHTRERLGQWIAWYQKEGYLRDRPTANYYWGYLTALSFAGIAAAGDDPAADEWLKAARVELSSRVLPAFDDELRGGGWPEGWQYGEYTTLEVALVARAFGTGAGVDVAGKLPWLGQTVTEHVHALLPDEQSVYDGGTWGEHPAKPSGLGMTAASLGLEGVDDAHAAEARWLMAHALPPLTREQAWLGLLADRPRASSRSPRDGAPTSLHLPGQGLTFMRSDWSKSAVWASFQAGPRLAEDHQDADQGHFELVRGSDQLLVDGGGSEGSATINHNTLLIDDGGENLNYPPNQGVWGSKVRTTRYGDDGVVVIAVGEIGEAYAPKCASTGCSKRSVKQLTRSFVFVRPSLLFIDDRVVLTSPEFAVTWAAHVTQTPKLDGDVASVVVGGSRVDVQTIDPPHAAHAALHEPTPSGEGSHRLDQPWGPMWRIEVTSPKGALERSFLHVIRALPATAAPATSQRLSGEGLRGAVSHLDGRATAVLFASPKGEGNVGLGGSIETLVVAGLEPGKRYELLLDARSCTLRLTPSHGSADLAASSGGFLRLSAVCGAK